MVDRFRDTEDDRWRDTEDDRWRDVEAAAAPAVVINQINTVMESVNQYEFGIKVNQYTFGVTL